MILLYISCIKSEFTGGACNLHRYVIDKFIQNHNIEYPEVKYISEFIWEEQNSLLKEVIKYNPDYIVIESSTITSNRKFYESFSLLNKEKKNNTYLFMHSSILPCDDIYMEDDLSPSLFNLRDLGIYIKLAEEGLTFLYASANIAYMSKLLTGKGELLPIENFISPNTNDKISTVKPHIKNNKVLFTNAYYHPASGNLLLMEAIRRTDIHEFEWYIVGKLFDDEHKNKDGKSWEKYYEDVINRPDVHIEGFKYGRESIRPYFDMCYYHLIPCVDNTYSFKAIEASSYGCVNVTTSKQEYLPWFKYAINFDTENSIYDSANNLVNVLRKHNRTNLFDEDVNNKICKSIEAINKHSYDKEFKEINQSVCLNYIIWYFNKICRKSVQIMTRYLPEIVGKYNRL